MQNKHTTKMIIFFNIFLLLFIGKVDSEQTGTAIVNIEILNVREGPGIQYPLLDQIHQDEEYPIIKNQGDWVQLKLSNQQSGWVANWLVTVKEPTPTQKPVATTPKNETVTPTVPSLRVRQGPGLDTKTIGYISNGDTYTKVAEEGTWSKINYDNNVGWVATSYIDTVKKKEETEKIIYSTLKINVPVLNVREEPTTKSKIVDKVEEGESYTVTKQEDNWFKIDIDNKEGWVHGDYVTVDQKTTQDSVPKKENDQFIVTASLLNVRDSASLDGNIISQLQSGKTVTVSQSIGKWSEVNLENQKGWVYNIYLKKPDQEENSMVSILYNGTNLRSGPSTQTNVVRKANQGEQFLVVDKEGDWYHIQLGDGSKAYIAGWIVEVSGPIEKVEPKEADQPFKGKTIVLDPGHGGKDNGTTGASGFHEQVLTLITAKNLADMLESAGANVILTRSDNRYLSLKSRVSLSHHYHADAFLSIHYDSSTITNVRGTTSFYYSSTKDKPLADAIHKELISRGGLPDRKSKYGNYFVLRENKQPAVLLELGFLSNATEEQIVRSNDFQTKAAQAMFYGLKSYFQK